MLLSPRKLNEVLESGHETESRVIYAAFRSNDRTNPPAYERTAICFRSNFGNLIPPGNVKHPQYPMPSSASLTTMLILLKRRRRHYQPRNWNWPTGVCNTLRLACSFVTSRSQTGGCSLPTEQQTA